MGAMNKVGATFGYHLTKGKLLNGPKILSHMLHSKIYSWSILFVFPIIVQLEQFNGLKSMANMFVERMAHRCI